MVTLMSQENIVALVSRTGRHLQRYNKGRRQVVGLVLFVPLSLKLYNNGIGFHKFWFFF